MHVQLIEDFADYKKGTIFAVVEHRRYWFADVNQALPTWMSDGKWIGPFLVGMPVSKFTHYCVTHDCVNSNPHLFVSYNPPVKF